MSDKEVLTEIWDKAKMLDVVMRNDDVSTEIKFYYFGIFIAELARIRERTTTEGR